MPEPIHLLVDPDNPDGAARIFDTVEKQFGSAEKSIEIFMSVWRNGEAGNRLGQEAQRRIDDSQRVESAADLKNDNRVLASLQQLHQWLSQKGCC